MTYHFLLRAINQETLNHLLSFAITSFSTIHLVIDYTENFMRILRVYSASNKTALSVKVAFKYALLVTLYVFPLCTIVYWRNFLQMSLSGILSSVGVSLMDEYENINILKVHTLCSDY